MKSTEKKFVCDLISLVANAVETGTIPEAEDYLCDKYQGEESDIIEHALNVMQEKSIPRKDLKVLQKQRFFVIRIFLNLLQQRLILV